MNRYANKGVCSLVIPDELRPTIVRTGQPIDYISGPITGVSRMNFGQFVEGCIAKAIDHSEQTILKDDSQIVPELTKISKIVATLKDTNYYDKIMDLIDKIKSDSNYKNQFLLSMKELGLYLEAPGFVNCELKDIEDVIYENYKIKVEEDIYISKDLYDFILDKLKLTNMPQFPTDGLVLPNIFCAPIYTLKLKQESYYRSSVRDFGSYKSTNYQPVQGRSSDGFIGASAKLGQMELMFSSII